MRISKMFSPMSLQRVLSNGSIFLLFCMLVGCASNPYKDCYAPIPSPLTERFATPRNTGTVKVRPVISEEEFLDIMDEGYLPIGRCSYEGPHLPFSHAIDVAEQKGADLVLVDEIFKTRETRTSVLLLPTTRTSYTYGNASYHGPYGSYGYGSYSGTTTTTDLNAVPITQRVNIYNQTVMFLRKVDLSSLYGVILYVPPRLPGTKSEDECPVTIWSVQRGSKAEADGLRRGKRVLSINGKRVFTRKDSAPYLLDPQKIKSIEVMTSSPVKTDKSNAVNKENL